MLVIVILGLTAYWLLSFFVTPIFPGIAHAGYFTDILSGLILALIVISFLL